MRRRAVLALAVGCLCACTQEPTEVSLRLVPAEAIGCQPTEVQSVVLRPLGDAPREERPSLNLDLSEVSRIDAFPSSTLWVSARAEGIIERVAGSREPWEGGGVAILDERDEIVLPLLRLRRACPLSDTRARVLDGGAVAGLADGRLVIAGGDADRMDLPLAVVSPGERVVRTLDLGSLNRIDGSATALGGDLVLLAGGVGRESFEVVNADAGEVVSDGLLPWGSRAAHGATRLPDGRVLLVGGRSGASPSARGDAEILEVSEDGESNDAHRLDSALAVPRLRPTVLTLDDGTVLVLGGVDDAGEPVATVERFDVETETFTAFEPWLPIADAAYVALAGGRVARVGGLEAEVWTRGVSLLLERGEVHVPLGAALRDVMTRPAAVELGDGRLLAIGEVGGAPATQILDPGGTRDDVESDRDPVIASRAPSHLVRLIDGTIAELNADGLSLLRVDLSGPFDDPSASINPAQLNERAELSLDAPGRWEGRGDSLVATTDGARFDLPSSRFAAVSVTLESAGPLELLLTVDAQEPLVIRVDETEARIGDGGCAIGVNGPLTVRRDARQLRLASGDAAIDCVLERRVGRVGVAVRAEAGSGVRRLTVTRL